LYVLITNKKIYLNNIISSYLDFADNKHYLLPNLC